MGDPIAEWRAHAFCDDIPVGADLAPIVAAFDREYPGSNGNESMWHYELSEPPGHRFMFPGAWMDRSNCDVLTDSQGRVESKNAYILYVLSRESARGGSCAIYRATDRPH